MSIIRVLHVVTKMDAAGIETLLMNFYRKIDKSKVQFDFLTHRKEKGFYDDEILALGGRIYYVPPINPCKHKMYIKALNLFFKEHSEYRIVHSHINTYSMYPLRAAMDAGVPVRIAHSHIASVPIDLKTPFRIYTKLKLKKFSTYNFACSELAGIWLYGIKGVAKDNFSIINNSIDSKLYIYDERVRERVRKEYSLKGKFVLGHIGRFNKQKNHELLVDIFKKVYDKNNNAVLMLVGEGELLPYIKKKIVNLGLQDKVIFTGVRSNVFELLQAMDIFVFPSYFEGLGIVAIEAQAGGMHCIVSDAIPNEAFVTELIESVPLKISADMWCEKILKYADGYDRKNTFEKIKKSGYDIIETTKLLETFYLQRSKHEKGVKYEKENRNSNLV